jgi:phage-related protein
MTTVGPGVLEIRVHTRVEHRVLYIAKFEEAVYVLHAFEKRTRQTPQSEIALAQKRLADLIRRRAQKPEAS